MEVQNIHVYFSTVRLNIVNLEKMYSIDIFWCVVHLKKNYKEQLNFINWFQFIGIWQQIIQVVRI